ncbi:MAG: DUF3052 domain-containing protein [Chloroflexi bacterium]|nr:DUF3052 domain-containing protein [Chloroflexota bacterium]
MPSKDYADRDVTDKLGLKPGRAVRAIGMGDPSLLTRIRQKVGRPFASEEEAADVILFWPRRAEEIVPTLIQLCQSIRPNGGIWVVTAKRARVSSSGMGYFNQDALIPLGREAGLVDNKICSISDNESAMRFVIRRSDR